MSVLLAAIPTPAPGGAQVPPANISAAYQLTKIGIRYFDAGVMADLMTRREGTIVVPPNFLSAGVRRIFVLESDNSLVIEATPDGLASHSR